MEAAQGTSYYQMVEYQKLVSPIVAQDPNVESFYRPARRRHVRSMAGRTGPHAW